MIWRQTKELKKTAMNNFDGGDKTGFTRHVFSADPVVRFQYEHVHSGQKGAADNEAVRLLIRALLEDAIGSYKKYILNPSRTNELLFRETEKWMSANNDGVFSFKNVCETLGLQPEDLRKRLQRWAAMQMAGRREKGRRLICTKGSHRSEKARLKARQVRMRKSKR